jgi:hypothetical protein
MRGVLPSRCQNQGLAQQINAHAYSTGAQHTTDQPGLALLQDKTVWTPSCNLLVEPNDLVELDVTQHTCIKTLIL